MSSGAAIKLAPPPSAPPASAPASAPKTITLKKGDHLFREGDSSKALYLLRSGMVRIYKMRGDTPIEIDTVRPGQILGELAFLDNQPRSASGEALTVCTLVEVSLPLFAQTVSSSPEWLKTLLKTIVTRMRSASTRIRQLEQASTAISYSTDGKATQKTVFVSSYDALKVFTALLLVGSRHGEKPLKPLAETDVAVRISLLQRYAHEISGVPVAKITALLDILAQLGIVSIGDESTANEVVLRDFNYLERAIQYMNSENLSDSSQRHDMTLRGFMIMSLIARRLPQIPVDAATGLKTVNVAETATDPRGAMKQLFKLEEFEELVKLGYASQLSLQSATEAFTHVKPEEFTEALRMQRVVKSIQALNEQKSKQR